MLQYLRLRGAPAFDPASGADIGPLKPVNFFFGPNGSGKTTISRALADSKRFAGTSLEWLPVASEGAEEVSAEEQVVEVASGSEATE